MHREEEAERTTRLELQVRHMAKERPFIRNASKAESLDTDGESRGRRRVMCDGSCALYIFCLIGIGPCVNGKQCVGVANQTIDQFFGYLVDQRMELRLME